LEEARNQKRQEAIASNLTARNGKAVVSQINMQIEKFTAEVDEGRIDYFRFGAGRPLLLLHGLLGGSFCWRRNIQAFSRQHTVFAIDLPGHGENDALEHVDCSMPAQAARVLSLLEHLNLEDVDMVGCSWGGAVAMFLAAERVKVRSLVLVAPVNPWSSFGAGRIRFLNGRIGAAFLRMVWPVSRPLYPTAMARMYGDPRRLSAKTVEGYCSQIMRPGRVDNILNTLRSWEKDVDALRAVIPKIKARSLLIWGTRDGAVDVRSADALKQVLPQCQLKLIEGAGHLPFEETPEEFNRLVLDFVDQQMVPPRRDTTCKAL
jgi:pimeloyl-ACP methyl ester carboxylesterase